MGYNLLINGIYWAYNPLTNHLLTSWDILVVPLGWRAPARCLTPLVGALQKGIWAPRNTHYIRCIWGRLLRVPSQGYQHFPYETSYDHFHGHRKVTWIQVAKGNWDDSDVNKFRAIGPSSSGRDAGILGIRMNLKYRLPFANHQFSC